MTKNNGIKISFIAKQNGYLKSREKGFDITIQNERLDISVFYDFHELPLQMHAEVKDNDKVEILILAYRIEVIVNKKTEDEEWPAGKCLYDPQDTLISNIQFKKEFIEYEQPLLPTVIDTFTDAQGWKPDKNVFVGDCMPYSTKDDFHVIYLKDRHHHCSKWGYGAHQWEHISTEDFNTWRIHPAVVEITKSSEGSICTGSWIKKGDLEYMFYTVRSLNAPAPIKRSVSKDGFHYIKDEEFLFTLSEKYCDRSARDPKIIIDRNGMYHMFVTTSLVKEGKGCLAHLTSADLNIWQEEENPIYISPDSDQPECPDYIEYNNHYYLIFSLSGVGRYLYSDKPFGEWKTPSNPIIPCKSVPKGAIWNGKIVFVGFDGDGKYAGTMTFKYARAREDGELVFE